MMLNPNEEQKKLWKKYESAITEEEKDEIMSKIDAIYDSRCEELRKKGFPVPD